MRFQFRDFSDFILIVSAGRSSGTVEDQIRHADDSLFHTTNAFEDDILINKGFYE